LKKTGSRLTEDSGLINRTKEGLEGALGGNKTLFAVKEVISVDDAGC